MAVCGRHGDRAITQSPLASRSLQGTFPQQTKPRLEPNQDDRMIQQERSKHPQTPTLKDENTDKKIKTNLLINQLLWSTLELWKPRV